jgi:putative ABC transport system permease protein
VKILQRKLFRDLRDLKAQVLTLGVLVICGVAVLLSSWSAYQSLETAQKNYYETFKFADIFVDFERAPADVIDRVRGIPGVEHVEGRIVEAVLLDVPGQAEPAVGQFVSWDKSSLLNQIYLIEGRFPDKQAPLEVLVHQSFAKAHGFHAGDQITVFFRGEKTRVQITGVGISPEYIYALSPVSLFPDDKHFGIFWMAPEALEQRTQMQGAYNNMTLRAAHGASLGNIKIAIDQILKPYGTLGSYDRSKQQSHMFIENEIQEQKSIATIIPGIFVLVGAFILNVVMTRLISLQRSQICILKALGYRSGQLALY